MSLPNHLTAFVSCNRVSKHLDDVITEFTTSEDPDMLAPPKMSDFYKVGDAVIGTVVAVEGATIPGAIETKKKRRRIELSLVPSQVNSDLTSADLHEGLLLPVEVKSVEDKGYVVDLGLSDDKYVGFLPFGERKQVFQVGSVVICAILSLPKKNGRVVNLQVYDNSGNKTANLKNFNQIRPGTLIENVEVKGVNNGVLEVIVNGIHDGEIDINSLPVESTLADINSGADLSAKYPIGTLIPLSRVVFADYSISSDGKPMILSVLPSILASDQLRRDIEEAAKTNCIVGSIYENSKIVRIDPGFGVVVELFGADGVSAGYAQVHISRLSDEKITKIASPYKLHSLHACRVIDYDPFMAMGIASMAPSCLAQSVYSIESLELGSIVRGEVVEITPGLGLLIKLSDRIRALCPTVHVTETQSADALKSFRLNQQFKFRVLNTDPTARRVLLTRKKGLLDSELKPLTSYEAAVVGEFYDGYVAAIFASGCVVRFYGGVKAFLPNGEMSEEFVSDAKSVVFEGQVIRCRVIKLDKDAESMLVSLRKTDGPKTGSKRKAVEEQKPLADKKSKKTKTNTNTKEESVSTSNKTEVQEEGKAEPAAPVDVQPVSPPESPAKETVKVTLPSIRDLEEEELAKEEMLTSTAVAPKATSNLSQPTAEELLSMKEMCEDYERRLLGSPNNSMLWIQYMSILIKSMEIDAARNLANRALQTISIRAEDEKLNVWIAMLNLEHNFGTPEALKAAFERACVYNDSKAVHLALARIYEESATLDRPETIKTVEEFYSNNLLKKFRQSCKVWVNLATFHFITKKSPVSGRKLLTQALEALPRRKHIKATLKFAQLEFRHGSLERGRTLFEGVLASSPGRLDIWSQYCDQEERHLPESTEALRRLFNRIVSLKLSSKKAKFFFKRFLDFEKKWGDQLTVQHVKDLAQQYVEATMNK